MDSFNRIVLASVITFFLTLGLSAGISYLGSTKGGIGVIQSIDINGTEYAIIEIENYSNSTINGLKINVPFDTDLKSITVSTPIGISINNKITNKQKLHQIILREIPPNHFTKIFIPIEKNSETIYSVNHKELNLSLYNPGKVANPIIEAFKTALLLSTIYTIIFSIFNFFQQKRLAILSEEIKKVNKELTEKNISISEQLKKFEPELMKAKYQTSKLKIFLLSRLSDYAKELTFWRDTIRKIIYQSTKQKVDAELLIETVTKSLKTYGAKSGSEIEFTAIETMAKILSTKK